MAEVWTAEKVRPLHEGMVCRTRSGHVCTILHFSDTEHISPEDPMQVVYRWTNSLIETLPIEEFRQKFTVLYDGKQLAPEPDDG